MERLSRFPLFIILMACSALCMLAPVFLAVQTQQFATARAFFYSSALLGILTAMIAMTLRGFRPLNVARAHLITLVSAYLALPVLFALPVHQAIPDTTFFNCYFEMISSFTTTGASTFGIDRLDPALQLWRAEVAWLGGLFVWITVAAIFAPLNLGGYEIFSASSEPGRGVGGTSSLLPDLGTPSRLLRISRELLPVYFGLTGVLWISMIIVGTDPLQGLVYAMSTMSTSGITLGDPSEPLQGGFAIELLILLFLLFAISRRAFSTDSALRTTARLIDDPEMRTGLFLILAATLMLFLRHFLGAVEVGTEDDTTRVLAALWGSIFTVVSFLTTTGFVSENWVDAQSWSGLSTPGYALLGLAMIGGGVATTAGGVKLLRVFVLYIHGRRELRRLLHPSMVTGQQRGGREVARAGVYVAWLFFMLFALSLTAVWVGLSATGIHFEHGLLLAVAALSTTGPLAPVVSDGAILFSDLGGPAKAILMIAMILGRLETLALVAVLSAQFWRT